MTMRRLKLHLDASVRSFFYADDAPEPKRTVILIKRNLIYFISAVKTFQKCFTPSGII